MFIVIAQPLALRFLGALSQRALAGRRGARCTGLGLGAIALAGGAGVYVAVDGLWTLGEIGFSTAAPALIAELSPVEQRGTYQGTFQLGWGLASMVAPIIGSQMLARLGAPALWLWLSRRLLVGRRAARPVHRAVGAVRGGATTGL